MANDARDTAVYRSAAPDDMARVQSLLLRMLVELDRVSKRNGLRYFLAYGTLIGAVREHGFIPWDVDVDVFVPVDDYETLCSALAAELPEDLFLYSSESVPRYEHTFSRIGFRGVDHKILRVDLYPLGGGPQHRFSRLAYSVTVKVLNLAYMLKLVRLEEKIHYGLRKRIITRLAKIPLALIPARAMLWGLNTARERDYSGSTTLADSCGFFGERQFFDSAWFERTVEVELAGHRFSAPVGMNEFLQHNYGDFMTPVSPAARQRELTFAQRYYVTPLRELGLITS